MTKHSSVVAVYTGSRGSGKTLSMTVQGIIDMVNGRRVWSNYEIKFSFVDEGGKVYRFQSEPLDIKALYVFDKEITDGVVLIDEINLWADARRSMGVTNRLLNAILQMIRKKRLSFYLTTQNFQWLDSRIRWQTDAWVACRDLSFKYAYKPGEYIAQAVRDMSGLFTGDPYDATGRSYQRTLHGEIFWHFYDTLKEYDPLQAMKKVTVEQDNFKLKRGEEGYYIAEDLNYYGSIQDIVERYRDKGQAMISSEDLKNTLNDSGIEIGVREVGKYMRKLGCTYKQTRQGNIYLLENEHEGS